MQARYGSGGLAPWVLGLACLAALGAAAGGAAPGRPAATAATGAAAAAAPCTAELVAGGPDVGDGGPATAAVLAGVGGLAVDRRGNVYLADSGHNRVRRVDARSGVITTVAGTGEIEGASPPGRAAELPLFTPGPLALDAEERKLFIAEVAGHRVLALELATGALAELPPPPLGFGQPVGLLWSRDGLLVVDTVEGQVWQRGADGWHGRFAEPLGGGIRAVAEDRHGDLYVSEFFSHRIWRWQRATGAVTPFAGNGDPGRPAEAAAAGDVALGTPDGLLFDGAGNLLFSDIGNARVSRIDGATGALTTLLAPHPEAGMDWAPGALARDARGNLWVGDVRGQRVLRFPSDGSRPTVAAGGGDLGDGGPACRARLGHPGRIAVGAAGEVYVSDALTHRVRRVDPATGRIATVAGTGIAGYNGDGIPAARAQLNYPGGLAVDARGRLFIGDYYNQRVRMVEPATGLISTVAGTGRPTGGPESGPAAAVSLLNPHALSLDAAGGLLVTSAVEASVHRIQLDAGTVATLALDPREVPPSRVLVFYGIAAANGGFYLADGMRSAVLFAGADGTVTRVVAAPELRYPMDVAVAPSGELFICDTRNNRVVRWTGKEVVTVVAGLARPRGIAFDRRGVLYVADTFHNRVVRVALTPRTPGATVTASRAPAPAPAHLDRSGGAP